VFNQAADLSTYRKGKSVRTTRATSVIVDMQFTCNRIDIETDADRHRVIIDLYSPSV